MKKINTYISEKLVINKDSLPNDDLSEKVSEFIKNYFNKRFGYISDTDFKLKIDNYPREHIVITIDFIYIPKSEMVTMRMKEDTEKALTDIKYKIAQSYYIYTKYKHATISYVLKYADN